MSDQRNSRENHIEQREHFSNSSNNRHSYNQGDSRSYCFRNHRQNEPDQSSANNTDRIRNTLDNNSTKRDARYPQYDDEHYEDSSCSSHSHKSPLYDSHKSLKDYKKRSHSPYDRGSRSPPPPRSHHSTTSSKEEHGPSHNNNNNNTSQISFLNKTDSIPSAPSSWKVSNGSSFRERSEKGRGYESSARDRHYQHRHHQYGDTPNDRKNYDRDYEKRPRRRTNVSLPLIPSTYLEQRTESIFKRLGQIGEGTYGKVYKAINSKTQARVALKRLRLEAERDGLPITALREIKLLQSINHKNIISLKEILIESSYVFMVFDYADHDLSGILSIPNLNLTPANIKHLFKQSMEALEYIHRHDILHRDIKGSNILVTNSGDIKIADFGLARHRDVMKKNPVYTNRVITLWYRPPELLLGACRYDAEVDIWGMGCILLELYTRSAIFQANDEIGELLAIYQLLGTPSMSNWPDACKLPWYDLLKPSKELPSRIDSALGPIVDKDALKLAKKMLSLNPSARPTAKQVLSSGFFSNSPLPQRPTQLENLTSEWHDFEAKQRKKRSGRASMKEPK